MIDVGKKFRIIYERKGYERQSDFAKVMRVSKAAVGQWFSGETSPSDKHILHIMLVHPDINKDWLLFNKGPVFTDVDEKDWKDVKIDMLQEKISILEKHISTLESILEFIKSHPSSSNQ